MVRNGAAGCRINLETGTAYECALMPLLHPAGCKWGRVGYNYLLQGHTWVPSAPTTVKSRY